MKRLLSLIFIITILFSGCGASTDQAEIAATTLPVYDFTSRLCQGTDITVTRLVTESVSCLHDYSLNVNQVRSAEAAEMIVISGAGLEDFMADMLAGKSCIDASAGLELLCGGHDHDHGHAHDHDHEEHSHGQDPHIWLSPVNAKIMARNICDGLTAQYPQYSDTFSANLDALLAELDALQAYGEAELASLTCREIITFHDGFAYFAEAFGLTILAAVEEEAGAETSAQELKELITLATGHSLPAVFTETNGGTAAARIISADTGAAVYSLDMAMSGDSYFDIMYRNIDTIKEALE